MTRDEILKRLLAIFEAKFEITNPNLDDNLRDAYEFDSIDAIELLVEIERMLGSTLSQEEKKRAMDIRTLDDVVNYIESLAKART